MGAAKIEHWEFECDHCKQSEKLTVRIHQQANGLSFDMQKQMTLPNGWEVFELDCFCPRKDCREQLAWRKKCAKELERQKIFTHTEFAQLIVKLGDETVHMVSWDRTGLVAYIKVKSGRYTIPKRFDFPFDERTLMEIIAENRDYLDPNNIIDDATPTLDNPNGTKEYLNQYAPNWSAKSDKHKEAMEYADRAHTEILAAKIHFEMAAGLEAQALAEIDKVKSPKTHQIISTSLEALQTKAKTCAKMIEKGVPHRVPPEIDDGFKIGHPDHCDTDPDTIPSIRKLKEGSKNG